MTRLILAASAAAVMLGAATPAANAAMNFNGIFYNGFNVNGFMVQGVDLKGSRIQSGQPIAIESVVLPSGESIDLR